jgi:hypothetical protein
MTATTIAHCKNVFRIRLWKLIVRPRAEYFGPANCIDESYVGVLLDGLTPALSGRARCFQAR